MITVNEWCAGGEGGLVKWGLGVLSMAEMRKGFCPNFLQPFLGNIDRRSGNNPPRTRTLDLRQAGEYPTNAPNFL